jgi:hypothetical protein
MSKPDNNGTYDWFGYSKLVERRNKQLWLALSTAGIVALVAIGAALYFALYFAKVVAE